MAAEDARTSQSANVATAANGSQSQDAFIRIQSSYHFLNRNKTLYDVILSSASAGTLAGKVIEVAHQDCDIDEDDGSVTFECK